METQINRLLIAFERLLRETNREIINPQIDALAIDDLRPVAALVARARAAYLKRLHEIAQQHKDAETLPDDAQMTELGVLRGRFLDLVEGAKSFETAIQRGYLDVKPPAA